MRTDLLALSYQIIKNVPSQNINMEYWVKHNSCGTIGCAAGHLASNPTLQLEGLYLAGTTEYARPAFSRWIEKKGWFGNKKKILEQLLDFNALAALFQISTKDAGILFGKTSKGIKLSDDKQIFLTRMEALAKKYNFSLELVSQTAEEITTQAILKASGNVQRTGTNTQTVAR